MVDTVPEPLGVCPVHMLCAELGKQREERRRRRGGGREEEEERKGEREARRGGRRTIGGRTSERELPGHFGITCWFSAGGRGEGKRKAKEGGRR